MVESQRSISLAKSSGEEAKEEGKIVVADSIVGPITNPFKALHQHQHHQQHQQSSQQQQGQLHHPSSFIYSASSPSFNMSFTSQTYDSSEMTDIDIDPELFSVSPPEPKPPVSIFELIGKQQHQQQKPKSNPEPELIKSSTSTDIRPPISLMSILTGNTKKLSDKRESESSEPIYATAAVVPSESLPPIQPEPELEDSEISDTSFTESKSIELRRDHDVRELEKKMYKQNTKSISAKDLFSRLKKKDEPKVVEPESIEVVEVVEPVEIIDLSELEIISASNVQDNSKRTTAKNIFKSFKQTSINKSNKSLSVTLKVKSSALKDIEKYDNPLITRGNHIKTGSSAKDILSYHTSGKLGKKSLFVTLKVNSTDLREIEKYSNPLITRGNKVKSGSSDFFTPPPSSATSNKTKSLFDSMMQASRKLSPFQSLKELHPLLITKDLMHIYSQEDDEALLSKCFQSPWNLKRKTLNCIDVEEKQRSDIFKSSSEIPPKMTLTSINDEEITKLVMDEIPDIEEETQLNSIYERFIVNKQTNTSELWIDLFEPPRVEDLLMSITNRNSIKFWISNAFLRLKNQSLKNPRNVLLKQKKRKDKQSNSFIVDDSLAYDDDETEEDIFVPLLILEGSSGSGKSSSIYAAMKEMEGYVHEINSGSHRGRKDIYNGLKEFCTTQLVHQQKGQKEFQQGLVLFEDVDILFEQDKNFWLTVQDILNISRKPIVLTCESLQSIPKNIIDYALEEDSIINIDENTITYDLVKKYLWLCCLSQGYHVSDGLISGIIEKCFNGVNYDIRKCIMECQFLCSITRPTSSNAIVNIDKVETPSSSESFEFELSTVANQIECASAGDVISSNSYSVFNHKVDGNELPEICNIDESLYLRHPTLPIELDIGKHMKGNLTTNLDVPISKFTYRFLRDNTAEFIGSRSKKLPKFIQDLSFTRRSLRRNSPGFEESGGDYRTPEPTGIPDTSFLNYINPTPLVTELLPFCRYWVEFQTILNLKEEEQLSKGLDSVKRYLNYRDFQSNTTIIRRTLSRSMPT